MCLPSLERVRALLKYDPSTGVFTWLRPTCTRLKVGSVAGGLQSLGYRQIMIDGRRVLSGRLAWFYVTGRWPEYEIDHANGLRDDDRFCNLREASRAQNNQNRRAYGKSRVKGAHWIEKQKKWRCSIGRAGKTVQLGMFDTAEAAGAAYAKAAQLQYGEFARAA